MSVSDTYRDGSYAASHPLWHTERSEWKAQQICKLLDRNGVKPSSVLDIGCGAGQCLLHVAQHFSVTSTSLGIEPSPDVVSRIPEGSVQIKRLSIGEVDSHFDLGMMLDVFEHVDDYLGFLRISRSKARLFAFHIPLDVYALRVMAGRMTTSRRQHGHLHYFSLETALATLADTGYSVIDWTFTQAGFEGPNRTPNSPLNLVRRAMCCISPRMVSRLFGGLSLAVLATDGRPFQDKS